MHVGSFPAISGSKRNAWALLQIKTFSSWIWWFTQIASSWKVCNTRLCKMGKIGLSHWHRSSSHGSGWAGRGERVTIKKGSLQGSPFGAAVPVIPVWAELSVCPLVLLPLVHYTASGPEYLSAGMKMVLVWTRRNLQSFYTLKKKKKKRGEADVSKPCQILLFPKQGGDKGSLKHTSRHKEHVFALQIQAGELSSLSQELVTNSIQLNNGIYSPIHIVKQCLHSEGQLTFLLVTNNTTFWTCLCVILFNLLDRDLGGRSAEIQNVHIEPKRIL